ncbi:MAG: hypothetical protein GC203_18920 [Phenylobacterium sp.]|uniref:SEC-C domain-containing protein n=1 Tax=Phenylobacterium sp. TaxID=1871053 RepID=UPI0025FED7FA|nr:SEC-C domain-containing protein [Phenylobacterium sp.]MBI1199937.1 hypothetical protein [Phenylobacterium sp.]
MLALCGQIRPDVRPFYLRVTPEADCEPLGCFSNVERKVGREGGRAQTGWAIWIWPRVFVEAEHHAVFAPASGAAWRDITPAGPGVRRRLFLPDDTATYDLADPRGRRDNIRLALSGDPLVAEMFAGMEARTRIWRSNPGADAADDMAEFGRLQSAELAQGYAQSRLAMKYAQPNDPCVCGSGRRFKACHGRKSPR